MTQTTETHQSPVAALSSDGAASDARGGELTRAGYWGVWVPRVFVTLAFSALAIVTVASLWLGRLEETHEIASVILLVTATSVLRAVWFRTTYPQRSRSRANVAFFFAHAVLVATLCWLDTLFGFYAWIGFVDATLLMTRWWSLVGVSVTAVVVAISENDGVHIGDGSLARFGTFVLLNVGIAWSIGQLVSHLERQSEERRALIAQLEQDMTDIEALHAELAIEARERGRLDERTRVARDLHDTVAQGLVGIVAQLTAAQQDGRWQERATMANSLASASLEEARRAIAALASPVLDEMELTSAIDEVTKQWSATTGIPVCFTSTEDECPVAAASDVVKVCQEALSNAARHADASRVVVDLTHTDSILRLDIGDDGQGFEPSSVSRGLGLMGIEQRAASLGGTVDFISQPGQGCVVTFAVPTSAEPNPLGEVDGRGLDPDRR